ncbi:AMP-binding protein [Microvirga antarctica]|uniref:AMP-binding protein n=1 Tax=Microvirga antarctica TaxID=2819233 RepID=UPI001B3121F2|nr:AMP-binding protein [Microvirga antarctica]
MIFEMILDPERSDAYVADGLWNNRTLIDAFDEHVGATPDKMLCVAARDVRWSYRDVADKVEVLAANLAGLGIGHGDVLSVQLPNWGEFLLIHLAATRLGAVTNSLLPIYRSKDIAYIIGLAKAKVAIIPNDFRGYDYPGTYRKLRPDLPDLERIFVVGDACPVDMTPFSDLMIENGAAKVPRRKFDGNDVTILIFTSGTESSPKGVMHSHNSLMYGNLAGAQRLSLTSDEVVWAVSPICHATGIEWNLRQAVVLGGTLVMQEIWNPELALELIEKERCTYTCAATPFATMLLESPSLATRDLSSFRVFLCGGAAIPPTLGAEVRESIGCNLVPCWGMSECFAATMGSVTDPDDRRWGTDGSALPGAEVAILGEDRISVLKDGEIGEIGTRGPHVCLGYFRDPERTAETFSRDGWLFSNDLGFIDDAGYLKVVGRKKDIINRGGLKVSAQEVETAIAGHPVVLRVALVGIPDRRLGEKGCAFIVPREGKDLSLEDVTGFLDKLGIAKYKFPEFLCLVEELPMTPTGKVQKFKLKEDYLARLGSFPRA